MSLKGKRVLVTGGTGFIGGRLVEKLILECGARVRVLVRDIVRASRVARFDLQLIQGDVTDAQTVRGAVTGCDVVFHCAYGNRGGADQQRAVNVDGTRAVADAVLRADACRMVHVSTIAVYGQTADGNVDEDTAPGGEGDHYSQTKREAEQLLLDSHRRDGLPVAVLRPSCVYGPYGLAFTIYPLEELSSRRVVLVNGGNGLANMVYVDDVADALLVAAAEPRAIGEVFLISGARPVTWKELYASYERMLGVSATVPMTLEEVRAYAQDRKKTKRQRRAMLNCLERARLTGEVHESPVPFDVPNEHMLAFYSAKTTFRIDKARQQLGYQPRFDLQSGMELTERWARWTGLIQEQ